MDEFIKAALVVIIVAGGLAIPLGLVVTRMAMAGKPRLSRFVSAPSASITPQDQSINTKKRPVVAMTSAIGQISGATVPRFQISTGVYSASMLVIAFDSTNNVSATVKSSNSASQVAA